MLGNRTGAADKKRNRKEGGRGRLTFGILGWIEIGNQVWLELRLLARQFLGSDSALWRMQGMQIAPG